MNMWTFSVRSTKWLIFVGACGFLLSLAFRHNYCHVFVCKVIKYFKLKILFVCRKTARIKYMLVLNELFWSTFYNVSASNFTQIFANNENFLWITNSVMYIKHTRPYQKIPEHIIRYQINLQKLFLFSEY